MQNPKIIDSNTVGAPAHFQTLEDLERMLESLPGAPADQGQVNLIVTKGQNGRRETPGRVLLNPIPDAPGDAKDDQEDGDTQLAIMQRDVAELIANGQPLPLFGDNLFLDLDLSTENLPPGSRLRVGSAIFEVTPEPHNGCRKFRGRFGDNALRFVSKKELRHRNLRGIYMRVLEGGEVRPGDPVEVLSRP
ncbi:MAG: MOSC domain-containing protein [Omnitrophica WOR_2 bacterium]